jgi:hypothetical protein
VLREIAWRLREIGNDGRICDLIDSQVAVIEQGAEQISSDEAKAALQANVRYFYDMFVADVAKGRKVSQSIVRADPEKTDKHFGGGRVYPAKTAVALGMADRVATLDETVTRLSRASAGSPGRARSSLITL